MTLMAGVVVQIEAYPKAPLAVIWDGSGNTISHSIDTEGYNLTGLLIPDNWNGGATITFNVAEKGEPETSWPPTPSEQNKPRYRPLFSSKVDFSGTLTQVKIGVAPGQMIALSQIPELKGFRYIQIVAASAPAAGTTIWATRVQYVQ